MTDIKQADIDAMESILWVDTIIDDQEAIAKAFARHRQYGYDQGYYDGQRDRQLTQDNALRDLVATLWCASGCSCCRDDDAWEKASHELAELLGIPKYNNGSGYDWYSVCDAAKGQSK